MQRSSLARGTTLPLIGAAVAAGLTVLAMAGAAGPAAATGTKPAAADLVARGRLLVTIGSCNDCHTPWKMTDKGPAPDMSRMLSGHPEGMKLPPAPKPEGPWIWSGDASMTAFAGPWGVSFAANLTPDAATGLGTWTPDIFIKAMRTGRHWGQSRPILPPMPWQNIGQLSDQDLEAIFAYLRSIPPITNHVPDAEPMPQPAGR